VVDQNDFAGIHFAAQNLAEDFARVTEGPPSPPHILAEENYNFTNQVDAAIVVGSVEGSSVIGYLGEKGKLAVDRIRGKWESWTTAVVDNPFTGCRTLVVAVRAICPRGFPRIC
jgi:hypothetical protein